MRLAYVLVIGLMLMTAGCMTASKEFSRGMEDLSHDKHEQFMDASLTLRGMGVKYLFLAKVFTAGLYLPADVDSRDALDPKVPKSISVVFNAKIASRDFANYTISNIRPNITPAEFTSLKTEMERLKDLFPPILPGDSLALVYKPGEGTSFVHNGQTRGTVAGELFSKAIFSTWIGAKPFDQTLKKQVLGMAQTN